VPPALTGESRKATRTPGKSDPIDARAVALAAIREGVDSLPVAFLDEQAHEIRVLCDYRDQLMHERIRVINRLRWHLVRIAPELDAQLGPAALKGPRIRARLARQLGQLPASPDLRVAKAQLRRINEITKEQLELFDELTTLVKQHAPQLLEQRSIGPVTAAVIIGRTAGAQRFRSEACFARHAGTAPIPANSGNTVRYRLHRGGDRQLNRAIHIIARAASPGTPPPASTSHANKPKARPSSKPSDASNATSPARSGTCSTTTNPPHRHHPRTSHHPSKPTRQLSCAASPNPQIANST
jgi:transposase